MVDFDVSKKENKWNADSLQFFLSLQPTVTFKKY